MSITQGTKRTSIWPNSIHRKLVHTSQIRDLCYNKMYQRSTTKNPTSMKTSQSLKKLPIATFLCRIEEKLMYLPQCEKLMMMTTTQSSNHFRSPHSRNWIYSIDEILSPPSTQQKCAFLLDNDNYFLLFVIIVTQ